MQTISNSDRRYANKSPKMFTKEAAAAYVAHKEKNPQYDWVFIVVPNFNDSGLCIVDIFDADGDWVGHVAE